MMLLLNRNFYYFDVKKDFPAFANQLTSNSFQSGSKLLSQATGTTNIIAIFSKQKSF